MAGGISQKTRRLTACAVLCALNLVVMYFGTVIEVLDLTASVVASLACIFAVIEMGVGYGSYMSELSAIVKPDIAVITNVGNSHKEVFGRAFEFSWRVCIEKSVRNSDYYCK